MLCLYLREKSYYYMSSKEKGEIEENQIEEFLKNKKEKKIHLVISKPRIFYRKIVFPFSQKRKVELSLPVELEDLLPKSIDNFVFSWYFLSKNRNKSEVVVIALEKDFYNFWLNLHTKYKFSIYFSIDSLLIFKFFSNLIKEKNYFLLFIDEKYFLVNLVENGLLSNTYSYYFSDKNQLLLQIHILKAIFSEKNYPLFWYGKEDFFNSLSLEGNNVSMKEDVLKIELPFFLNYIGMSKTFSSSTLKFKSPKRPTFIFSAKELFISFVFLLLLIFMVTPYFKIPDEEKKVKEIQIEMEQTLKETCPEISKIVNPVIQIKEKLRNISGENTNVPKNISILKIMAEFTKFVPENLNVEITQFIVSGNSLFISGKISDLQELEKLKESIKKSEIFYEGEIGNITFDNDKQVNFNLMVKLK